MIAHTVYPGCVGPSALVHMTFSNEYVLLQEAYTNMVILG